MLFALRNQLLRATALGALVVGAACGGSPAATGASGTAAPAAHSSAAASGQTYTIKYAVLLTPNDPIGQAANEFKDLVESRSDHRISVQVYLNGALGDGPSEISQAQSDAVQVIQASPAFVTQWVPQVGAVNIWFSVPNDAGAIKAVNSDAFSKWNDAIRTKAGLRVLAWEDFGMYAIETKKPIRTAADLKGLKIRSTPDKYVQLTLRSLGAVPTVVPFPETVTDLQTGVLDGDIDPIVSALKTSEYQVAKYITIVNGGWGPALILMSDKFYQQLPPDLQKIVIQAGKDAADHEAANYASQEKQALSDLASKGAVLYTLPAAERQSWIAKVQPVYARFKKDTGLSVDQIVPKTQ
ncbi:MAG: TRAP transporter substrate-binding protein [Chloroflexota bacterium]|nr:TRAP transporter substrate-binding protein [Chloroflexota bacterium]